MRSRRFSPFAFLSPGRLRWILFVSRRFSRVDRSGKSAVTTFLASLGICFGVMTLVVVVSVMNGFQLSFIDSILEVSSYHVRVSGFSGDGGERARFEAFCAGERGVVSFFPFYEAQSLIVGRRGLQGAALVRAVPADLARTDAGFAREMRIRAGRFDLGGDDSVVLGSELSRTLGVRPGDRVNLFALSGGSDVELFSDDRLFTVTGVFATGFSDINAGYAFISLGGGEANFGKGAELLYGIKLADAGGDERLIARMREAFPGLSCESWKEYNRSFFGALRVEKNMLMLLVFLIFVVVGINIFNGMRRMVYERREEISVFQAFGGRPAHIQAIFVMQGFLTGFSGASAGLALGLLLSVRMRSVFWLMSKAVYCAQYFFALAVRDGTAGLVRENPMFMVYASVPTRIMAGEVLAITVFGIFSSLIASFLASTGVLRLKVAEVMRDE